METSDELTSEQLAAKQRRLANLRPPFQPGQSGNPSGLAKDGLGSKDHPIRATLRAKLAKRRALHRLVDTWIDAACDGDSAAREQILKRLDPVTSDDTGGRQVVFEGLRLEMPDGTRAEVIRSQVQSLQGDTDVSSVASEASTHDVTLSLDAYPADAGDAPSLRSVAVHDTQESRGGALEQPVSGVSPAVVVRGVEESCVSSARSSVDDEDERAAHVSSSGLDGAKAPTAALRPSGQGHEEDQPPSLPSQ